MWNNYVSNLKKQLKKLESNDLELNTEFNCIMRLFFLTLSYYHAGIIFNQHHNFFIRVSLPGKQDHF